jgi:hypothetical protein
MMRDTGFRDLEPIGDLACGQIAIFQYLQYLTPGGVVQSFKKGIHGSNYIFRQMSKYYFKPQNIFFDDLLGFVKATFQI